MLYNIHFDAHPYRHIDCVLYNVHMYNNVFVYVLLIILYNDKYIRIHRMESIKH